jgi:hypothetical protein
MPGKLKMLAIAAALVAGASTAAMAQYACPVGYAFYDGACRPTATPGGVVSGAIGTAGAIANTGLGIAGGVVNGTVGAVTGAPYYYGSSYPPGYYAPNYYYGR